ncbi:MAG: glucose-6-phosphate isomerase [Anaerolineae bacterium]
MHVLAKFTDLGFLTDLVSTALSELETQKTLPRIWEKDHTVWRPEPQEIANRLDWLTITEEIRTKLPRLEALRDSLLEAGYTDVLLLGMGGSSLAPEVFGKVFAEVAPGLRLQVLDSTEPRAVQAHEQQLDLRHTLFIVASKSGRTVETLSFFKYFYNRMVNLAGKEEAGEHFLAITDPGSKLATLSEELDFRECFLNNPNIGGRYSALSYFGLVPAALVGVDVARLLDQADDMRAACGPNVAPEENPAAWLGVALGELAKAGRDKLTLIVSPAIAPFGDWVEQLIAESTGKEGTGILPVVHEPLGDPAVYSDDRLFIHLRLGEDTETEKALQALVEAGHPVVRIPLEDRYDLGGQFFLWELATAVAGARLNIQPFNQPNVEAAKRQARRLIEVYEKEGALPTVVEATSPSPEALCNFLAQARPRDYVALQAYVPPTPETWAALQTLRLWIRDRLHLVTTLGYGPRYLHSTGQLHKGDGGNGLFIQFLAHSEAQVPIPNAPGTPEAALTFAVLVEAQAQGDYQALREAGRRVIHFRLHGDVPAQIRALTPKRR